MSDTVKAILEWLERVVPTILSAFGLGYSLGKQSEDELRKQIIDAELRLKLKEDEINNLQGFNNLSPSAVIDKVVSGEFKPGDSQ